MPMEAVAVVVGELCTARELKILRVKDRFVAAPSPGGFRVRAIPPPPASGLERVFS